MGKADWSADYWQPGNHIYEFYKNRRWVPKIEKEKPTPKAVNPFIEITPASHPNISFNYTDIPFRLWKELKWEDGKCIAILPTYDEELGVWIDYSWVDRSSTIWVCD